MNFGYKISWVEEGPKIGLAPFYIETIMVFLEPQAIGSRGFYCDEYSKLLDKKLTKLII